MRKQLITSLATLSVILLILATGCKSYVRYKHGITNPKEETPQSLITFLEQNKYPVADQFMFRDSAAYRYALGNETFISNLPGHMIFDRAGLLLVRDTTKCQWAGADLLRKLHPDSTYGKSESFSRDWLMNNIVTISGEPAPAVQTTDFTVVVIWAKFLGQYNYRLFDLEPAIRENKYSTIRMVWLNVDMQKNWHLKPDQKLKIK